MAAPLRRPGTLADLAALPDHVVGELVAGELWTSPRPRPRHARAAHRIGADLDGPFDRGRGGPGGWLFLPEPELHLGGDVLVPDLAAWRTERWRPQGDEPGITVAPDWLCEVLSPSTARLDRVSKMDAYARAQVGHVWLVDPALRTLECYRLERGGWLRVGTWADDAVASVPPFAEVELSLSGWWL